MKLGPITSAESARRWRELVDRARIEARNGAAMDRSLLQRAIVRVARAPFPIEGQGATLAAGALRDVAQAYVGSLIESRIWALADMLEACAVGVDKLLDEPAQAIAAEQRRRLGEREEV